jgi:hypothetical protein
VIILQDTSAQNWVLVVTDAASLVTTKTSLGPVSPPIYLQSPTNGIFVINVGTDGTLSADQVTSVTFEPTILESTSGTKFFLLSVSDDGSILLSLQQDLGLPRLRRSHRLQEMLNYFDDKDIRVRELPNTLDAQLLNTAAVQLDELDLRLNRETDSRGLAATPVQADNRGVYYSVRVPNSFALPDDPNRDPIIEGFDPVRGWILLNRYDDERPLPVRAVLDPSRSIVPLNDPVIIDVTGSGDRTTQIWDIKSFAIQEVALPNRLTFWIEGLGNDSSLVDIFIEGERYPQPAWYNERERDTEIVQLRFNGASESLHTWQYLDKVTVRGLPSSARLRVYILPVGLEQVLDPRRPYTDAGLRGLKLPTYWSISGTLLKESYFSGNYGTFEYKQSYLSSDPLVDVAVDPHSWLMIAATATSLQFVDRREPFPDKLSRTALTDESFWGLRVDCDPSKSLLNKTVKLTPLKYSQYLRAVRYRYTVEMPSGDTYVVTPSGALAMFSSAAGWRQGVPASVSCMLLEPGTYVFSLECEDQYYQVTSDRYPFLNATLDPQSLVDLSDLVSQVQGVAYDSREGLWIWDGNFAIPIKLSYDAYIFDRDSSTVYLTDHFDQVRLT